MTIDKLELTDKQTKGEKIQVKTKSTVTQPPPYLYSTINNNELHKQGKYRIPNVTIIPALQKLDNRTPDDSWQSYGIQVVTL